MNERNVSLTDSLTIPFEFQARTRIIFGPGSLDRVGDLASELGARRALMVSDRGIIQAGHTARAMRLLEKAGIDTTLFDGVHENPSTADVESGLEVAKRCEPEIIIGLGGGSSMDCAKGINFLFTNGGQMQDYWGVGKALRPMLPMIAIPTTAGTGSETQSFALISDAQTHIKMACGDKKASFRVALLDPLLTLTQPEMVTGLTGVDALAHAVETYVTTRRNPMSLTFSREAWRLLAPNLLRVIEDPNDVEARGCMQLGACLAGLAIENSMLGATHAMANPLTAKYNVVHGQAVGAMLPHVIRANAEVCTREYEELWQLVKDVPPFDRQTDGVLGLADGVSQLVASCGLETEISAFGVCEDDIHQLSAAAAEQWTGQFNPLRFSVEDYVRIYTSAMSC